MQMKDDESLPLNECFGDSTVGTTDCFIGYNQLSEVRTISSPNATSMY
jgi:hypothetical protein